MHDLCRRVYDTNGLSPTMPTMSGGHQDPKIAEPSDYRFYQQALETLRENECEPGDTIDAYNKRVNKDGVSPTITTRPDGFKTAILPVVDDDESRAVWNNDLGCFVDAETGEMLVGDYERPEPQKPNYRIPITAILPLFSVKKQSVRQIGVIKCISATRGRRQCRRWT